MQRQDEIEMNFKKKKRAVSQGFFAVLKLNA